jgi:hypothetical protein
MEDRHSRDLDGAARAERLREVDADPPEPAPRRIKERWEMTPWEKAEADDAEAERETFIERVVRNAERNKKQEADRKVNPDESGGTGER